MKLDNYLESARKYKEDYYKKCILMAEDSRYQYLNSNLSKKADEVLQIDKSLIETLADDKDINTYFSIYYYLLWNGYFSVDNDFIWQSKKKEIDSNLGLNITAGNGCCRNISVHFTNILNALTDNDFTLIGVRYKNNIKSIKPPKEIKQKVTKEEKIDKPKNIYDVNHLSVFYTKNKTIYDPQNFLIQKMNYDNIGKEYFIGAFDLGLDCICNPYINLEERLNSLSKKLETSKLFAYVEKKLIEQKELRSLMKKGIKICQENQETIIKHQQEVKPLYQYIKKEISKRGV